jgi:hypothetical protein
MADVDDAGMVYSSTNAIVEFEEIDVDADPRLDELYGADVPVLVKDEAELCRHRLTPEAIRRLS